MLPDGNIGRWPREQFNYYECRTKTSISCRVPEAASIHDKSYYTSNKDHLYRSFEDISLHVQASKQAELGHAASMYLQSCTQGDMKLITLLLLSSEQVQGPLNSSTCHIVI
jgi:hypothetical protein